jgi:hypothetical protein
MSQKEPDFVRAHRHSLDNQEEIEGGEWCGCFYCLAIFQPKEIDWMAPVDDGTAWCPRCGIDSVIGSESGYPITEEFLGKMYAHWFGQGKIIGEVDCIL